MAGKRRIAVIDVGKTNAKVALVDLAARAEIDVESMPNEVLACGAYPHHDIARLWAFVKRALAGMARRSRIDAVAVTTHGATAALVRADGSLAMPVNSASPLLRSRVVLARALALDPKALILEHPSANLETDDAVVLARLVRAITAARKLTTVALLMDEGFAKTTGDRLLTWQPATGELRERRSWRFPYF